MELSLNEKCSCQSLTRNNKLQNPAIDYLDNLKKKYRILQYNGCEFIHMELRGC
jgi:hypothetical protein